MASLTMSNYEPWIMAGWAFRDLVGLAESLATTAEDQERFRLAGVVGSLSFDLIEDHDVRRRVAASLREAADERRARLISTPSDDPRDAEFAEWLHEIGLQLTTESTALDS